MTRILVILVIHAITDKTKRAGAIDVIHSDEFTGKIVAGIGRWELAELGHVVVLLPGMNGGDERKGEN